MSIKYKLNQTNYQTLHNQIQYYEVVKIVIVFMKITKLLTTLKAFLTSC